MKIADTMKIATTIEETRAQIKEWRKEGLTIGLVPTMGFLHEGHKSLIDRAVLENDRVVVSDFVNPTQFGVGEDLESYPRDLERDAALCQAAGAHLIFHPSVEEMYEEDAGTIVDMRGPITEELCGKTRPTHFRGVCTVVSKLFMSPHINRGASPANFLACRQTNAAPSCWAIRPLWSRWVLKT